MLNFILYVYGLIIYGVLLRTNYTDGKNLLKT